ncbi:CES2 [Branchiostoma lanceolatum]|uniref:CES2 protein n=1 Tax=Branchiostoma lanceolatum TaxID=7740 RepID=A0A8K0A3F7_BRALA|nr:CES2 [Branchiostoma lanceolatum]
MVIQSVVIDGRFLPQSPWDLMNHKFINRVDYLLGTNNDEFGYELSAGFPYVDADGMTRTEFETYLPDNLLQTTGQYLGSSVNTILQPVMDEYLDPGMADDPIYLRDQYLQLLMDAWFTAPTVMMAKAESGMPAVAWEAPQSRVYQYELQHAPSVLGSLRPPYVGVDHADDLYLLFGIPLLRDEKGSYWKYSFTQEERDLSLDMMAYWVNFATNGDPNDSTGAARMRDMVHWPRFTSSSQSYLQLDVTSSADVRLRESRMKFWNEEVPRLLGKHVHNSRTDTNGGSHGASYATVVSTTHGDVRGSEFMTASVVGNAVFDRVFTFKGIPYAAPPVGDLRWRPPQDTGSWAGVRDVTEFGSRCPQDEYPLLRVHPMYAELAAYRSNSSSEDCLFLNVYTPNVSATANLPVMVWIHGGGWNYGSGETYPAEIPTSLHNVVMVTVNYRLGILGSLPTLDDDAPGNFGLLDMIKSLEWVQANIRNFGGDPDRVTIFGESAGGIAVSLLVMSPMATGLFHRAISQSGVVSGPVTQKGDITRTETVARGLNCTSSSYDDMMSCLRGLPTEAVLLKMEPSIKIVDGKFLLQSPWDLMNQKVVNRVDYLLGTNNDEFGFYFFRGVPYVDADGMSRAEFETHLPYDLQEVVDQYMGGSVDAILQPVMDEYLDPGMADDPIYLRDQYLKLMTDSWYVAPATMMAQAQSGMPAVAGEAPHNRVYQYELQHVASVFSFRPPYTKVDHTDDLFFAFGIPLLRDVTGNSWKYNFTQEERDLSLDTMAYWVNFATNGDPNDSTGAARMRDMVHWPRYTSSSQSYLKLDVTSSADVRLRESRMRFWNEEVPRLMGKHVHHSRAGFHGATHEASCSLSVLVLTLVTFYLMV